MVKAEQGQSDIAVSVRLQNNPGIAGFSFCVDYDKSLVLVESQIDIETGYKVVTMPTEHDINFAWTGNEPYCDDGTIVTMHFNVAKTASIGAAPIQICYRDGYDSFYIAEDGSEKDIDVVTVDGGIEVKTTLTSSQLQLDVATPFAEIGSSTIDVPISVSNNPGFSGFSFCINYDKSRLELDSSEILLVDGYKVIRKPDEYDLELAWTSLNGNQSNDTIAILHFSIKDDATPGKAYVNIAFREGYDSFYLFDGEDEKNIETIVYNGYVDIPEKEHILGEWEIIRDATCSQTGIKSRVCLDCGKKFEVIIPKRAHDYLETTIPPTCIEKGYTLHTCRNCGESYINTFVDTVPHTEGNWQVITPASCNKTGTAVKKCDVCNEVLQTMVIDKTDHSPGEWKTTQEALCESSGIEKQQCTNCGAVIEQREIPAKGHEFADWIIVIEPTVENDGEKKRLCKNCDFLETEIIPKLSESHVHDFHGKEEIIGASTCSQEGSKKVFCVDPDCNEYIVCSIPVIPHKYVNTVFPATPTEQGYTLHVCSVCGNEYKDAYTDYVDENAPRIVVSDARGIHGDKIYVPISLEKNPGIVSMSLKVHFDSTVMKLVEVKDAGVLGSQLHSPGYTEPYSLTWANDTVTSNFTANGTIVTLTFEIFDDVEVGQYPISISYDYDGYDIYNVDVERIKFETIVGYVNISDVLIGDVNGDGVVNNLDRLTLARCLANWPDYPRDSIIEAAADVNCDGIVNNLDRLILSRYLADWPEYSTLPYIGK